MPLSEIVKAIRSRARAAVVDERGIVLPVAVMLLAVILVLTLVVVKASTDAKTSSVNQVSADQALATAEAGLQTAYHRFSAASSEGAVKEGYCFKTEATQEVATKAEGCTGKGQSGETEKEYKYTYYVEPLTAALENQSNCAGALAVSAATILSQRCITSTATVNGFTRRVQERVIGAPEKITAGLESLGKIKINNAKTEKGNLRANGEVEPGSATVTGEIVGKPLGNKFKCEGCTEKEESNAVNGGNTKPNVEVGLPERRAAAYESAALKANNKADTVKFKTEVGAAYTEATRIFQSAAIVGEAKKPIQLESGVYNFCEVNFTQKVFLEVPKGAEVTIYIDSPERPGGEKCSSAGKFKATNGFCVKNANQVSSTLKMNFWGNNPGAGLSEFSFTNNVGECEPLIANVYAPYTKFQLTNGGTVTGNFLMGEILATNGLELGTVGTATTWNNWAPSSWTICKRNATGTNPASGCY